VLLSFVPRADIFAAIWPLEDSIPMLRILVVAAAVLTIVWPVEISNAVFFSFRKASSVDASILVFESALPMHSVLLPMTGVQSSLYSPGICAIAVQLAVENIPLVR